MDQQKLCKTKWREAKIKPTNTFARKTSSVYHAYKSSFIEAVAKKK